MLLCGRHHHAVTPFYHGLHPLDLPFCDQKGSEKVSLLRGSALGGQNDGRHPAELARSCGSKPHWGFDRCATPQPRLRGYSPLRTPKRWSKNPKAKKCRNDCIFLNAFVSFSRLTPSGPKFLYILTVGADACHRPAWADVAGRCKHRPLHFSETVSPCRGIGGGQPPERPLLNS